MGHYGGECECVSVSVSVGFVYVFGIVVFGDSGIRGFLDFEFWVMGDGDGDGDGNTCSGWENLCRLIDWLID